MASVGETRVQGDLQMERQWLSPPILKEMSADVTKTINISWVGGNVTCWAGRCSPAGSPWTVVGCVWWVLVGVEIS
jgi:hypothetical protein